MSKCGIIFQGSDFEDTSGCMKEEGHNDFHTCMTIEGNVVSWEDDYNCKCGCWDDDDLINVCKVYWEGAKEPSSRRQEDDTPSYEDLVEALRLVEECIYGGYFIQNTSATHQKIKKLLERIK